MTPETRYARSGDVSIAHQVVGEGPVDLVFSPGWVSHIEHGWEEPTYAPFLERMASFSRLILLDRRGTGLSDPVDRPATLEQRMDDIRAVLDAVGSERVFLFGLSESGPMAILFAATHPERTRGLILCNTFSAAVRDADHPWAMPRDLWLRTIETIRDIWGTGVTPSLFAPSRQDDPDFVRAWARFERHAVSPGGMGNMLRMMMDTDVRHVLPSIRVPTLVLHRAGDQAIRVESGRYIAEHVPGARFVELPGADHFPWVGDADAILDEVETFVTGAMPAATVDRILATTLFVDVVESTRTIADVGDRRWRELQGRFYDTVERQVQRYQGRLVARTGDGALAAFDGPARAIRCAVALREAIGRLGLQVRAGVHTGECELVPGGDLAGIAVHIAARVLAAAGPDEILVSRTVRDLVTGSGLAFEARGAHELKGVPGAWELFAVV